MSDLNPVAILLVTSGTRGDKLLFRYPFDETENQPVIPVKARAHNPYALKIPEDRLNTIQSKASASSSTQLIKNGVLVGFEDKTLANLLAVKTSLCGSNFTVKIDDVRFVGFPIQIEHRQRLLSVKHLPQQSTSGKSQSHRINTVNVVFALRANIVDSAIDSYHALAKELIVAICHEEKRCQYLSSQTKIIRAVFDHVQSQPEDSMLNPYRLILEKSDLAKELKKVYSCLVDTGVVFLHINRWVEVNFSLPHKVHVIVTGLKVLHLEPREVEKSLSAMKPYHSLLLLQPLEELLYGLPIDSSPSVVRLVKVISPLKNLLTLSLDADLSLPQALAGILTCQEVDFIAVDIGTCACTTTDPTSQVFLLACHLVYWGKVMVIFPLCESNEYLLSPMANTLVNSRLVEEFVLQFPGRSLHVAMADFSLPCQLGDMRSVVEHPQFQAQSVQMVVWMLRKRLLVQLHKYIYFVPSDKLDTPTSHSTNTCSSNVQVVEESLFRYFMDDHSNLDRATSMSDVASVNSDESIGPSHSILTPCSSSSVAGKHLSKSPSLEVSSDGEAKAHWHLQNSVLLKDLSYAEKCAVLKCPAAKNIEDLQLFAGLYPYFNGRHHLEEIMFYENLKRSQLLTLMDKFKDVLIMTTHECFVG